MKGLDLGFLEILKTYLELTDKYSLSYFGKGTIQREGYLFILKNKLIGQTLYSIYYGKEQFSFDIKRGKLPVRDFSSAYILIRSLFEAYIHMYYLIEDPKSPDERYFRLLLWQRHNANEQKMIYKKMDVDSILGLEGGSEKADNILKKCNLLIRLSNYFQNNLSKLQQDSILKDYSSFVVRRINKKGNREKITKYYFSGKADIHPSTAEFFYKFSSSHAHSESLSLGHIGDIENIKDIYNYISNTKVFAIMFMSLSLGCFAKLSKETENYIDKNPFSKVIIDKWEADKTKYYKELTTNSKKERNLNKTHNNT